MQEQEKKDIEERLRIEGRFQSGASWFFWIAGLSLINSIISLSGGEWSFIVGLGITQIIDSIGIELSQEIGAAGNAIAFVFDCLAAGVFVGFGFFARKGYHWAFIAGMILYALDGLLFLVVSDILSIGFHVFALYCIYGGFKASKQLQKLTSAEPPLPFQDA